MTGAQPKMKSQHIKSRIGFQVEERKKELFLRRIQYRISAPPGPIFYFIILQAFLLNGGIARRKNGNYSHLIGYPDIFIVRHIEFLEDGRTKSPVLHLSLIHI